MGLKDRLRELGTKYVSKDPSELYVSLDSTQWEIRLFRLLPGEWDETIRISTFKTELPAAQRRRRRKQSYEALSYTWGSSDDARTIYLSNGSNEDEFPVTKNLWLALRRLRLRDKARVLWVDAICINQSNLEEKGRQIRLMASIYSQAARVVVWLGECYDSERKFLGISWEQQVAHALQAAAANTSPSWFKREWVVQEFAVAVEEPLVQIGPFETDWGTLRSLIENGPMEAGLRARLKKSQARLDSIRRTVQAGHSSLDSFIRLEQETQATEIRDYVYSMLSMLPEKEAGMLRPDYNNSVAVVFAQATYVAIVSSQNYDILTRVNRRASSSSKVPSWAFDFAASRSGLSTVDSIYLSTHQRKVDKPWTREQTNTSRLHVSLDPGGERLAMRALHFDSILAVDGPFSTRPPPEEQSRIPHLFQRLPNCHPYNRLAAGAEPLSDTDSINWSPMEEREHTYFYSGFPNICAQWHKIVQGSYARKHGDAFQRTTVTRPVRGPFEIELCRDWLARLEDTVRISVFVTQLGFIGLGTGSIEVGDVIALPQGYHLPMALGPEGSEYTFQGTVFVCGIMDGQLWDDAPLVKLEEKDFVLV